MEAAGWIQIFTKKLICFLLLSFVNGLFYSWTDVKNKWEKSSWGRKLIVRKRRAALNDFDRFKIMLAKIKVCFNFYTYTLCLFLILISSIGSVTCLASIYVLKLIIYIYGLCRGQLL
jgi:hypothetical protein